MPLTLTNRHPLPHDLGTRLSQALEDLYGEPSALVDTTERAVVARWFLHLNTAFDDLIRSSAANPEEQANPTVWDVEYMRASNRPKAFTMVHAQPVKAGVAPPTSRRIAPDLLWHRRLLTQHDRNAVAAATDLPGPKMSLEPSDTNLLTIEVKLAASVEGLQSDWAKLALLTGAIPEIEWFTRDLRMGTHRPRTGEHLGTLKLGRVLPYRLGLSVNLFPNHAHVYVFERAMPVGRDQLPNPQATLQVWP